MPFDGSSVKPALQEFDRDVNQWFWRNIRAAFLPFDMDANADDGGLIFDHAHRKIGTVDNSSADITVSTRPYGRVLTFSGDATNDRVDLGSIAPGHPLYFGGEDKLSFVARLRYGGSPSSTFPRPFDKSNSGNGTNGYGLWYDTGVGGFEFRSTSGANFYKITYSTALSGGDEFDLGFTTVDGSLNDGQFYRDGASVTSVTVTTSLNSFPSVTTNMAIGNWNHATDRMWDGDIGFLYIFGAEAPAEVFEQLFLDPFGPFRPIESVAPFLGPISAKGVGNFTALGPHGYPMPPYTSFAGKVAAGVTGKGAGFLGSTGVGW